MLDKTKKKNQKDTIFLVMSVYQPTFFQDVEYLATTRSQLLVGTL